MKREWTGGTPVLAPNLQVRIYMRDGHEIEGLVKNFRWNHADNYADIVAYEILGDERLTVADELDLCEAVGNGDADGEGKQTNPKDAIGSRKAKFSVIPAGVLLDLGNAMTEGMVKYGRHNYRHAGVRANVYYDAAVGHLADWWEGQDIDPESGLSHVTKAIASLVVLRDAMLQGMLTDDRPPRSKVFKADFSPMTAEIIDRHKDKSPRHFTIADSKEAA